MSAVPTRITRGVAFTLRWGSYVSALLLLVGVVWVAVAPDVPIQAGPPMPLSAIGAQLADRNPYAVMQLGLLLLLLTPLARLAVAAGSFWREREQRSALVALGVLAIIFVTLLLARSGM